MQVYKPLIKKEWVSYSPTTTVVVAKKKPVEKPKLVIESKYTEEERAAYMEQVKAVIDTLKAAKWYGFCKRGYKTQKKFGHPEDYLLIAEKYKHFFYLTVMDNRLIEVYIEDPLGERLHGFYMKFDTELKRVPYASELLIVAVGKIITIIKDLRKINTDSRVFFIDSIMDDM